MANIRVKAAATYCSLSKSTLDKLRCTGGGPTFMRLGRTIIYSTDDLDMWLSENRQSVNDNQRERVAA